MALAVDAPNQVAINSETAFEVDLGGAKALVKVPAGAVVDIASKDSDTLLLKRGNAIATLPISATDYAQRLQHLEEQKAAQEAAEKKAQEERLAAEEAEKKRKAEESAALIEKAGGKPIVSINPITGSVTIPRAMARHIKSRLKDPDSFQARGVHKLEIVEKNGVSCWEIGITYAGKNSYGGYTVGTATAFMRGSELLHLELGK